MQLLCNGVRLDLYDGASLQFTKTNPLFAFGELSAERTTQFKLPCTPTNDAVLELARVPEYNGNGMRKKYDVQVQIGTLVQDGLLYITGYDGTDYEAVLVVGLGYDLKKFGAKEWGSLVLNTPYDRTAVYDADDDPLPMVAKVKFRNDAPAEQHPADEYKRYVPSIDLGKLFEELNSQGVLPISGMTGAHIRLIRNERSGWIDVAQTLINNGATYADLNLSTLGNNVVSIGSQRIYYDSQTEDEVAASCFEPHDDLDITFPDDMPDNLCVCNAEQVGEGWFKIKFLGTRYFDENGYHGEPLKGQTVHISGTNFFIIDNATAQYFGGEAYFSGDWHEQPDYSLQVRFTTANMDIYNPSPVTWHSMLNGLQIGELLKIYSVCTGTLINVSADGGVEFVTAHGNKVRELVGMKVKKTTRTFSDYAQKNTVQFSEDENVQEDERQQILYTIYNENIAEDKELLTLEEIEGGIYDGDENDTLYVRGMVFVDTWDGYELPMGGVLGLAGAYEYMQRVTLAKSNYLQGLCDKSTSVQMQARMSLVEFLRMDSNEVLLFKNVAYVWVEANWQNETAQFTLAKL